MDTYLQICTTMSHHSRMSSYIKIRLLTFCTSEHTQTTTFTEVHTLALEALTGGDASLVSRFVHHYSQNNYWVPDDYHEQVWHYLQHLPEETQRALYLLACIGGKGSTSLLRKFTNLDRRQLGKVLEQLPHWVRKEGHMWHLYVGATHYACTHLIEHSQGIIRSRGSNALPKWAHYCIEALKNLKTCCCKLKLDLSKVTPSFNGDCYNCWPNKSTSYNISTTFGSSSKRRMAPALQLRMMQNPSVYCHF